MSTEVVVLDLFIEIGERHSVASAELVQVREKISNSKLKPELESGVPLKVTVSLNIFS